MTMKTCPCFSEKNYSNCCEPFIKGTAFPATAAEMMRSRYSAYVVKDVDYIGKTNDPEDKDEFDIEAAKEWANTAEWTGLDIVETIDGEAKDQTGIVEFKAKFKVNGMEHVHHERSNFRKINNKWFFVNGKVVNTPVVNTSPKIGRNDPCSCGSGKKYKKCCG